MDIWAAAALSFFADRAASLAMRLVPADMTAFLVPFIAAAPPTEVAATAVVKALRDVWTLEDFSGAIPVSSVMASSAVAVSVVAGNEDQNKISSPWMLSR